MRVFRVGYGWQSLFELRLLWLKELMYVTSQSTHQCSVVTVSRSVLPSKALHYFHSLVWVHLVTSVAVVHSSLACFAQFTVLYISTLYVPNGNFTSLLTSCNALLLLLLTAVCILVAPLGLLLIAGDRLTSCVLAAARSFFRFLMPPECSDCSWNISIVKPTRCNSFSNLFYFVLDGLSVHHQEFKTVHTATGVCQTDTCCCMYSLELLMMDGKTVQNM